MPQRGQRRRAVGQRTSKHCVPLPVSESASQRVSALVQIALFSTFVYKWRMVREAGGGVGCVYARVEGEKL